MSNVRLAGDHLYGGSLSLFCNSAVVGKKFRFKLIFRILNHFVIPQSKKIQD